MENLKFKAYLKISESEIKISLSENYVKLSDFFTDVEKTEAIEKNVLRFIGGKDNTGIDLYEDDIIENGSYDRLYMLYQEFSNCGCCGDVSGYGFDFETKDFSKIKKVGNMHEMKGA